MVTAETVRALIATECEELSGLPLDAADLADDYDLRAHGVIDSLGFVELVGALEDRLDLTLDLGDLPPEELTTIGPLARAIAAQVAEQRGDTSVPAEARP
jgi:acyl carrier protein